MLWRNWASLNQINCHHLDSLESGLLVFCRDQECLWRENPMWSEGEDVKESSELLDSWRWLYREQIG